MLLVLVVGLASAAEAQPDRSSRQAPPPPAPAAQQPLLRGPAVQDAGIPGTQRAFSVDGATRGPQQRMLNREIPMPDFMGAIRGLNAPDTPHELNLTAEQREVLAAVAREHAQAVRVHLEAHREELGRLAATLGVDPSELAMREATIVPQPGRQPGRATGSARVTEPRPAAPGASRQPDRTATAPSPAQPPLAAPGRPEQRIRERLGDDPTPAQREALERLREIREAGPSALDAQTRAWNALAQPQQQFVLARIQEGRARQQAQRGEAYVREMMQRQEAGLPNDQRAAMSDALAEPGSPAERLHRLIDRMTPRQQERLLRSLEGRLSEQPPAARPGRPGRPAQPDRRPPPPAPRMDQVNVPKPEPI